MGKSKGANNRALKTKDVIAAFAAHKITLLDTGHRKLTIKRLPAGITPDRPLVLHYGREGVQEYEARRLAKSLGIDLRNLNL